MFSGTVYVGLGVATAFAGSARGLRLAAAVDRDGKLERQLRARRDLRLEPLDDLERARRGGEQPPLDLLGRVELTSSCLNCLGKRPRPRYQP